LTACLAFDGILLTFRQTKVKLKADFAPVKSLTFARTFLRSEEIAIQKAGFFWRLAFRDRRSDTDYKVKTITDLTDFELCPIILIYFVAPQ
jgi:hypothetical protein